MCVLTGTESRGEQTSHTQSQQVMRT